jgi:hypothetical protein
MQRGRRKSKYQLRKLYACAVKGLSWLNHCSPQLSGEKPRDLLAILPEFTAEASARIQFGQASCR